MLEGKVGKNHMQFDKFDEFCAYTHLKICPKSNFQYESYALIHILNPQVIFYSIEQLRQSD